MEPDIIVTITGRRRGGKTWTKLVIERALLAAGMTVQPVSDDDPQTPLSAAQRVRCLNAGVLPLRGKIVQIYERSGDV